MTIENEVQQSMENCKNFIRNFLQECCEELIEYDDTGILKDGKIRQAMSHLTFAYSHRQNIVISLVESLAIRGYVQAMSDKFEKS